MITTQTTLAADVNFNQFRVNGDSAIFLGPLASDINRDQLSVRSLAPKAGNGFLGNRRSTLALIRSTSVTDLTGNSVVRDRKVNVDFSMPVGVTEEQLVEDAHEIGKLLQDPAFVKSLALVGQIEY